VIRTGPRRGRSCKEAGAVGGIGWSRRPSAVIVVKYSKTCVRDPACRACLCAAHSPFASTHCVGWAWSWTRLQKSHSRWRIPPVWLVTELDTAETKTEIVNIPRTLKFRQVVSQEEPWKKHLEQKVSAGAGSKGKEWSSYWSHTPTSPSPVAVTLMLVTPESTASDAWPWVLKWASTMVTVEVAEADATWSRRWPGWVPLGETDIPVIRLDRRPVVATVESTTPSGNATDAEPFAQDGNTERNDERKAQKCPGHGNRHIHERMAVRGKRVGGFGGIREISLRSCMLGPTRPSLVRSEVCAAARLQCYRACTVVKTGNDTEDWLREVWEW